MRVQLVLPTLDVAGMETVVVELASRLQRRGHDVGVTCILASGPLASRLEEMGIGVSLVPLPGVRPIFDSQALVRHFRRIAPDVVHSHSGAWLKSSSAATRAGVPAVIHTVHGLPEPLRWRDPILMKLGSLFSGSVVAVSESLTTYLGSSARVKRCKLRTILNGVDTTRFGPQVAGSGLRRRFQIPGDSPLIGNVARLTPVKDQATLIRAFALISKRIPNAHLVLVGTGPLEDDLRELTSTLNIDRRVHFAGQVEDTAPVYRELDVFALSSRIEGTSMSILEAFASAVPVVATAVGGTPQLAGEGEYALLVPSESPADLAEGICTILLDENLASRLSAGALAHVRNSLSVERMVDNYERLYASVLEFKGDDGHMV